MVVEAEVRTLLRVDYGPTRTDAFLVCYFRLGLGVRGLVRSRDPFEREKRFDSSI